MPFDTILNDIWNCFKDNETWFVLKKGKRKNEGRLLEILKSRPPTILEFLKIMTMISACILTLFETMFWEFREHFVNKDGKWCVLLLFDTMFWAAAKILKAVKLNGASWRFLRMLFFYARYYATYLINASTITSYCTNQSID